MVMEKQNVIDERTPDEGIKIAAAVDEAVADLTFEEFNEETESNEPTKSEDD